MKEHQNRLKMTNFKHCSMKMVFKGSRNSQNILMRTSQPVQDVSKPWNDSAGWEMGVILTDGNTLGNPKNCFQISAR